MLWRSRALVLLAGFGAADFRVQFARFGGLILELLVLSLFGLLLLLGFLAVFGAGRCCLRLQNVVEQFIDVLALEFLIGRVVLCRFLLAFFLHFFLLALLFSFLGSLVYLIEVVMLLEHMVLLDAFAVAHRWVSYLFPVTFKLVAVRIAILAHM